MKRIFFFALALVVFAGNSMAASESDIDRLTSYAVILGRASGCGINTQTEARRVGQWMDAHFDSQEKPMYLTIFVEGMKINAVKQSRGESPDTCGTIRSQYSSFPWP